MTKEDKKTSKKVADAAKKVADKVKSKKKTDKEIIEELKKQNEELRADFLRSRADYENFRKRSSEELMVARDKAIISFVEDLLPAIDNFEMSLKMTDNKEMFVKGVEMIHSNLIQTLKEHKFEEFSAKVGEEFNPNLHDPILIEDKTNKAGTIVNVLSKGYKHKNKIIRPIRVQIPKTEE